MSNKIYDKENRWRSLTVGFHMSPEEAEQLNIKVKLSGLPKQEYLIKSCLNQTLHVVCGRKVAREMQMQLEAILEELQRVDQLGELEEEVLTPLRSILEIIGADEEMQKGGNPQ